MARIKLWPAPVQFVASPMTLPDSLDANGSLGPPLLIFRQLCRRDGPESVHLFDTELKRRGGGSQSSGTD